MGGIGSGAKPIHGHATNPTPEYRSWYQMKQRCLNKRNHAYARYGGKGITIDPAWYDFINFLIDMGPRPSLNHTLERINNSLGYFKANCKWATYVEQVHNRPNYNVLTKQDADDIRRLYASGKYLQKHLASQYGVTSHYISKIVRRRVW